MCTVHTHRIYIYSCNMQMSCRKSVDRRFLYLADFLVGNFVFVAILVHEFEALDTELSFE